MGLRWVATQDCSESVVDQAKKLAHDGLIADLGARRRTAVTWTFWDSSEAEHLFATNEIDHDAGLVDYCRAHPEGWLILASAEADPE